MSKSEPMTKSSRERVSVYLPTHLADEARKLAAAQHIPLSSYVRILVIKAVEGHKKKYIR